MKHRSPAFWKEVPLAQMSRDQWESLCDGCAKCCLIKLLDDDTEETAYTRVACRLLDDETCRCRDYANRSRKVPGCVVLTPQTLPRVVEWLPGTCAYRLLHEGADLPDWHPLVSGEEVSVERAGMSIRGWTLREEEVPEEALEDHIVPQARIDSLKL